MTTNGYRVRVLLVDFEYTMPHAWGYIFPQATHDHVIQVVGSLELNCAQAPAGRPD
jgi:hypothetical protein